MWRTCRLFVFVPAGVLLLHHSFIAVEGGLPLSELVGRGELRGQRHSTDESVQDESFCASQHSNSSSTNDEEATATLNFEGEFRHHHDIVTPSRYLLPDNNNSVPWQSASKRRLYEFFQNRVHRDLLLKGGDNPTEEIPWTPELFEEWAAQARVVSSAPPKRATATTSPLAVFRRLDNQDNNEHEQHHSVVAIHSTVPIIPGLFIKAVSYMGCNLLSHPHTLLPMYEFTLIQDRYQAEGTRALVWLYRRITGEASTNEKGRVGEESATNSTAASCNTQGLCRVFLEPFRPLRSCDDGANIEEVVGLRVSFYSIVKVTCKLPQRLLKLLPLSKQNIEAKISASMARQLEMEVRKSAEKFHTAWEAWLELQQHHNEL